MFPVDLSAPVPLYILHFLLLQLKTAEGSLQEYQVKDLHLRNPA
jgi:hypothetical protein